MRPDLAGILVFGSIRRSGEDRHGAEVRTGDDFFQLAPRLTRGADDFPLGAIHEIEHGAHAVQNAVEPAIPADPLRLQRDRIRRERRYRATDEAVLKSDGPVTSATSFLICA